MQNEFVFSFLKELFDRRRSVDNKVKWRIPFESLKDLKESLREQLIGLLDKENRLPYFFKNPNFINYSNNIENIIDNSGEYRKNNFLLINYIEELSKMKQNQYRELKKYYKVFSQNIDKYANQMISHMESSLSKSKGRIYVSDNSMETIDPYVWENDYYHQLVFGKSVELSRKYNFSLNQHIRIMVVNNPSKLIIDEVWKTALKKYCDFHLAYNIKCGIVLSQTSRFNISLKPLENYFIIPNKLVSIFETRTGIASDMTVKTHSSIVSEFTDIYDNYYDYCSQNRNGFWIEGMSFDEIIIELAKLTDCF